ncbi:MAG TPA: acyl-CoA dehydrogenase family protein [Candidatus Acidoferrales bacterium]|nr:acyl-CoA dehydrogenase family protein [Candidatus Acidoferrales bacterium]
MKRAHFEPEHEMFRKNLRAFIKDEVTPHYEEWERDGITPKEVWKKAGANGFLCTWADEAHGGAGVRDFRYDQIVCEEGAGASGVAFSLHSSVVAPYLDRLGNEEQKRRLLPRAASGDAILALAMTEPAAGSDLAGIKTRAELRGDHWLLNGSKTFISNGINADIVIVAAKTDPANPRRIGLFIVETGMRGFERGRKLEKLGYHAQDTAEMFFNDVKVPCANVLGDPQKGFHGMMQLLADERLISACGSLALARAAFDITLPYVRERKAFGQAIAEFQHTRFKLAEMKTELDLGQVFVDRCVMDYNAGELTPEVAAQAKLWTSELVGRVTDQCVQFFGGYGYMWEYPITRIYASARIHRIWAGTTEIMKEIISRSLLADKS